MPKRVGEAEIKAIEHVYGGVGLSESDFSREFLNAVPLVQVEAVASQLLETYGAIASVHKEGDRHVIETATHRIPVKIALDAKGRIASLVFRPAQPLAT